MSIFLLMGLILLNGVFAMAEIALVTARQGRLRSLAAKGDRSAAVAVQLGGEPTRFLSTLQIGITAIGILNGIVGEAVMAAPLAVVLERFGLDAGSSAISATLVVVVIVTYVSIVIGELVPKRMAQCNAEEIARRMARPVALLARLTHPFVVLLSISTDGIVRLLGKKVPLGDTLTAEDIHTMLVEGSQSGLIEKQEQEMVRNVFRLDDRPVASLMTPRSEIEYLDIEQAPQEHLAVLLASDHGRFPVCRGDLHRVLGVVTARQLLKEQLLGRGMELCRELLPATYVPESLSAMKLLEQFRNRSMSMVFVIDEYGEITGLVTLQDLLEALTGEFIPWNIDQSWVVEREDGSLLIDGLMPVLELKDRLEIDTVPDEGKGRYHTLGGMMMWLIGNVPHTGDIAHWQNWRFEVVDLDGNRVDKVLVSRLPETTAVAGAADAQSVAEAEPPLFD